MPLRFIDKETQKGVTGASENAVCASDEQWEKNPPLT